MKYHASTVAAAHFFQGGTQLPRRGQTVGLQYICTTKWDTILELEAKSNLEQDEEEELDVLKNSFSLALSVNYQMLKLVPYWRQSAQPGSTNSY